MIKKISGLKIRTKLAVLILVSGFFCLFLFRFLWLNRWNVWEMCIKVFPQLTCNQEELLDTLRTEAQKYELPASETDRETRKQLEPFFALTDDYTSISLYGMEDRLYRAGKVPQVMSDPVFRLFFDSGYSVTGGDGEDSTRDCLEFKNGFADVILIYYHRSRISYPWFLISITLSIMIFLAIVLFFVNHKIRHIISLKDEVLLMASGDLTHPVPDCGEDEIGILSQELNKLRIALDDNIVREQQSRKANQDLITALSHDLRTPLTILNGYLEVLRLKRNPEMQEEYLNRCLQKTEDIKEMTDRMFEYALVSEENETPDLTRTSTDAVSQCLRENCDFIRLAGFDAHLTLPDSDCPFLSDSTMLKRVINNLFSNILKYGDKKNPVCVTGFINNKLLDVRVSNTVKQEHSQTESTHIGLKSAEKIMTLIGGEMHVLETENDFTVQLLFPLL